MFSPLLLVFATADCRLMRVTADTARTKVVDLYNSVSGTWSTAQLSVARYGHAGASVGNRAIFAGGQASKSTVEELLFGILCCNDG